MAISKSSKSRLTVKQLLNFTENTLFDKIARAVCKAGTLPAKELYEAWEFARRVRRKFRGGRVVDLACGHGLLGHIMILLDDSSKKAFEVDLNIPDNALNLSGSIIKEWPRLKDRIEYIKTSIEDFKIEKNDIVVSVHACGILTDTVIDKACEAGAKLAVLPCCHDFNFCDTGGLQGWIDGSLAIDIIRAQKIRSKGYKIITKIIPKDITPKNRLLMAEPD